MCVCGGGGRLAAAGSSAHLLRACEERGEKDDEDKREEQPQGGGCAQAAAPKVLPQRQHREHEDGGPEGEGGAGHRGVHEHRNEGADADAAGEEEQEGQGHDVARGKGQLLLVLLALLACLSGAVASFPALCPLHRHILRLDLAACVVTAVSAPRRLALRCLGAGLLRVLGVWAAARGSGECGGEDRGRRAPAGHCTLTSRPACAVPQQLPPLG